MIDKWASSPCCLRAVDISKLLGSGSSKLQESNSLGSSQTLSWRQRCSKLQQASRGLAQLQRSPQTSAAGPWNSMNPCDSPKPQSYSISSEAPKTPSHSAKLRHKVSCAAQSTGCSNAASNSGEAINWVAWDATLHHAGCHAQGVGMGRRPQGRVENLCQAARSLHRGAMATVNAFGGEVASQLCGHLHEATHPTPLLTSKRKV